MNGIQAIDLFSIPTTYEWLHNIQIFRFENKYYKIERVVPD